MIVFQTFGKIIILGKVVKFRSQSIEIDFVNIDVCENIRSSKEKKGKSKF